MSVHDTFRTAVLEGRIKAAASKHGRADTLTGSLAVHTVNHDGTPAVFVSWQQGVYITPEQWATVTEDLGLDVAGGKPE